jgi:two-component system OmpR family sensor kinase
MSLRVRLLAASLALVTLGLLVADVATYTALRRFLYRRVDEQVVAADQSTRRALASRRFVQERIADLPLAQPGIFLQFRDDLERVVGELRPTPEGTQGPKVPDKVATLAGSLITVDSAVPHGPRYRLRIAAVSGGYMVVGLPLADAGDTLHRLLVIEALVTLAVLGGAAALGVSLVRLGLRPLADIEATAATITAGDMTGRVPNDDTRTEVGRLGRALNTMLDALGSAFARQQASEESARQSEERMRQFVADASHELRTPVAAVRAYAELYRRGADTRPVDLARLLSRIEQEASRMGVLVDDLLLLTRLDEGRPLEKAPVDVGRVAADAVEAARAVEPDRPLALEVDGSVEVLGDRDRLRQVVDNLLANVRSHTPAGAPADVRVRAADGVAYIEVADRGPGMSRPEAEQAFERFYRVDPGRSRDRGGSGLGLSIVAAIVAAHEGRVGVLPRIDGGGALFRVELPVLEGPVLDGKEEV